MNVRRLVPIFVLFTVGVLARAESVTAVTFADKPGQTFLPLRPTAKALGWTVDYDAATTTVVLRDKTYKESDFQLLYDGTKLLPLREFAKLGAVAEIDGITGKTKLVHDLNEVWVEPGTKRVEVSIADQTLRAWQGDILVMETNISSGRAGHRTPTGKFKAGPAKTRMHYSRLYNNSPMPYSVQVHGHVFIHGYHSVPRRPASHGCIRMPLRKKNAARYFFNWVDLGTPVWILKNFQDVQD